MYATLAFLFTVFTKVLAAGFVKLTQQLEEWQVKSLVISKSRLLRIITVGKQLENVCEELNEKMAIPLLIMLASIVINLTISTFITALTIEQNQLRADYLSLIFSSLLFLITLKSLCSSGSELTSRVSMCIVLLCIFCFSLPIVSV